MGQLFLCRQGRLKAMAMTGECDTLHSPSKRRQTRDGFIQDSVLLL